MKCDREAPEKEKKIQFTFFAFPYVRFFMRKLKKKEKEKRKEKKK